MDNIKNWFNNPGGVTQKDLSFYRIIFGLINVCLYRNFSVNDDIPATLYHSSPGMLQLFNSFPPHIVFIIFDAFYAISAIAILFGFLTPFFSLLFGVNLIIANGFVYAFGKIDHGIVFSLIPIILAFSGWGKFYSLDQKYFPQLNSTFRPWTLRYLALVISVWLFTASLAKIGGGWLTNPISGSKGYFMNTYLRGDAAEFTSDFIALHTNDFMWKFLDYATVLLEAAPLLLILSWRYWKLSISFLVFFHVGVFFSLSIFFNPALMSYAAFVPWIKILKPVDESLRKFFLHLHWVFIPVFAILASILNEKYITFITTPIVYSILFVSTVIAGMYILQFCGLTKLKSKLKRKNKTSQA